MAREARGPNAAVMTFINSEGYFILEATLCKGYFVPAYFVQRILCPRLLCLEANLSEATLSKKSSLLRKVGKFQHRKTEIKTLKD